MKVLLITDTHHPSGGTEKYFFSLKEQLKQTTDIEVYSIGFAPQKTMGIDYKTFSKATSRWQQLWWMIFTHKKTVTALKKIITSWCPDIIHLHNNRQFSASILSVIRGYPTVQTVHDFSYLCPERHNTHYNGLPCTTGFQSKCFFKHRIKFSLLVYLAIIPFFLIHRWQTKRVIQHFIAPSPFLQRYLHLQHITPVTFIPPFIEKKSFYAFTDCKDSNFLFVGMLATHKGILHLLHEFKQALHRNSRLYLTIAGTGPDQPNVQRFIMQHHLQQHIRLIGWQDQLDAYYHQCCAVIFPSTGLESFGLVITEAMSHARAVIGVNRGPVPWLIDDQKTGLLFEPQKTGDLADKILKLAQNFNYAKQLGKAAFEKLQHIFENKNILKKILSIYDITMNKHSPK